MPTAREVIISGIKRTGMAHIRQCAEFLRAEHLKSGQVNSGQAYVLPDLPQLASPSQLTSAANAAVRSILDELVREGELAVIDQEDVDCAPVTARYAGGCHFGNVTDQELPADELSRAICADLRKPRPHPCNEWPLYVLPADFHHLRWLHDEGRSELFTNFTAITSLHNALINATAPELRLVGASWEKCSWPTTVQARQNEYLGDAEVSIGGQQYRICACFFGNCHQGIGACRPTLEALHHRMHGEKYILIAVRGYSVFRNERNRWPDGVHEVFPGPVPESGRA